MDHSLPGSSVHGILEARILEWIATALLQGIFPTQGWNLCLCISCSAGGFFITEPPGKPSSISFDPYFFERRKFKKGVTLIKYFRLLEMEKLVLQPILKKKNKMVCLSLLKHPLGTSQHVSGLGLEP